MSTTAVEVRCPNGPRRLFAKLKMEGNQTPVTSDNLIEMACADCRKQYWRNGEKTVTLVLHRFNIVGDLVETEVVRGQPA